MRKIYSNNCLSRRDIPTMMINCRLLLSILLLHQIIYTASQEDAKTMCARPKDNFETVNRLYDYLECVKTHLSARYTGYDHNLYYINICIIDTEREAL